MEPDFKLSGQVVESLCDWPKGMQSSDLAFPNDIETA